MTVKKMYASSAFCGCYVIKTLDGTFCIFRAVPFRKILGTDLIPVLYADKGRNAKEAPEYLYKLYKLRRKEEDIMRKKDIEILMLDGCTKSEAQKHLERGTVVISDFEEHFAGYMEGWGIDEEEQEEYRGMIEKKEPLSDWGIVEDSGNIYYIQYVL